MQKPRRSPRGGARRAAQRVSLLGLFLVAAVWAFAPVFSRLGNASASSPRIGRLETFATLWASELAQYMNISATSLLPPTSARYDLGEVARRLKHQGIDTVFVSFRWDDQEPTPGAYSFKVQDYVQQAVCAHGLKLAVLFDTRATPAWVLERHPDAVLVDGTDHPRQDISFSHGDALHLVHQWQGAALAHLAAGDHSCIHSVQPSFNNEYETKFTQEYDSFQDYSAAAMTLFREYMRSIHGSLQHWNDRWGTTFDSWAMLQPPPYFQNDGHYNTTSSSLLYWDFQHFRQMRLHSAHETSCMKAASHGFKCILHFGEFFSGSDAIYAGGVVFTLAASPWVDYIVVDSNFKTAAGQLNDVRIVQVLISAMKPFGKPVFFEGAFEQFNDKAMHQRAVALTVASGAYGVGFTNWLEKTPPTFFEDTLRGYRAEGTHAPLSNLPSSAPAIALITPYRSYYAYKGVPLASDGTRAKEDPQQEQLFECLNIIERAMPSVERLQIFGAPLMLSPVLSTFQHIWFLEPDFMLSGDAKTVVTLEQQAAALGIPWHNCMAKPKPAVVLPECCPSQL